MAWTDNVLQTDKQKKTTNAEKKRYSCRVQQKH